MVSIAELLRPDPGRGGRVSFGKLPDKLTPGAGPEWATQALREDETTQVRDALLGKIPSSDKSWEAWGLGVILRTAGSIL